MGVLARGAHWFVILNMFPYTNGHVMIVANRHIEHLGEISPDEGRELVSLLAREREGAFARRIIPTE